MWKQYCFEINTLPHTIVCKQKETHTDLIKTVHGLTYTHKRYLPLPHNLFWNKLTWCSCVSAVRTEPVLWTVKTAQPWNGQTPTNQSTPPCQTAPLMQVHKTQTHTHTHTHLSHLSFPKWIRANTVFVLCLLAWCLCWKWSVYLFLYLEFNKLLPVLTPAPSKNSQCV